MNTEKQARTSTGIKLKSTALGSVLGALLAGGSTYAISKNKEHRVRDTALASVLGALGGGGLGLARVSRPARAVKHYEKAKDQFRKALMRSGSDVDKQVVFDFENAGKTRMFDDLTIRSLLSPKSVTRQFKSKTPGVRAATGAINRIVDAAKGNQEAIQPVRYIAGLTSLPVDTSSESPLARYLDDPFKPVVKKKKTSKSEDKKDKKDSKK